MRTRLDLFPIDGPDLLKACWLYDFAPSRSDVRNLLSTSDRSIEKSVFMDWVQKCERKNKDNVQDFISILNELKLTEIKNGKVNILSNNLKHILQIHGGGLSNEEFLSISSMFEKNGVIDAEELFS